MSEPRRSAHLLFVDLAFIDRTLDPEDPSPKVIHYQGDVPADEVYGLIEKWGLDD